MARMTRKQIDAFLTGTRIAKLVTLYEDGSPSVVPVWFEWDGRAARLFTMRTDEKIRRILADPRVCLSVEEPVGVEEAWVTIEGTASLIETGVMDLVRRLARRYYAPDKAERQIKSWEADAENWVIVEVTPTRIRSRAHDRAAS
jgi:PPOX class probable F420-dependent enzyme